MCIRDSGSTVAICPIDEMTVDYLRLSGRDSAQVALVEAYARAQGLFGIPDQDPSYANVVEFDLGSVEPSIAGPKRPQDRIGLSRAKMAFTDALPDLRGGQPKEAKVGSAGNGAGLDDGAVVVAAITSCTNTSNPSVMLAAGLVAQKAAARGLMPKPWVKTSLAPGSLVVTEYLEAAGLLAPLGQLRRLHTRTVRNTTHACPLALWRPSPSVTSVGPCGVMLKYVQSC
mgnify:CR=1 FL=1